MNLIYYAKLVLMAKGCLTLLKYFNSSAVFMSFDLMLPDELTGHMNTPVFVSTVPVCHSLSHSGYFPVSLCCDPSAR